VTIGQTGGPLHGHLHEVLGAERTRRKEEYFPGPLPLVRLDRRSDWADDERDTGFGLIDRGRSS